MPQSCKTCALGPKIVNQIERDFIKGVNLHQLSKTYGVSRESLLHHVENHLPKRLSDGAQKDLEAHASHAIEEIHGLYHFTKKILERNYDKQWDKTALKAIGEARGCLQLMAQIEHAHYQRKLLEIEKEKSESLHASIPLERLTEQEKETYFKILQKLLGDGTETIDLGYADVPDVKTPTIKKRLPDSQAEKDGGSEAEDQHISENPTPRLIRRRKPKLEDEPMTFQPLENSQPTKDSKLQRTRRSFSRMLRDPDDTRSPLV